MNTLFVIAGLLVAATASVLPSGQGVSQIVRAPAHDSAVIESHRHGGNFAYASATAEAYARITPQYNTISHPVAETTHVHQPAAIAHVQPAPIENTHYASHPVHRTEAILAQQPIIGAVGQTTHVQQPIYKTRTLTHTAPQVHVAQVAHASPVGYAGNLGYGAGIAQVGYANQGYLNQGVYGGNQGYLNQGVYGNQGVLVNQGVYGNQGVY